MDGQPKGGSIARRRAAAAAVCSVLVTVVGGALLAAPASADALGPSDSCSTSAPTSILDTTGAGTGAIDLGSSSGLVGVNASSTGVGVGLLDCATGVTLGSDPSQPTSTTPSKPVSHVKTPSGGSDTTDTTTADTTTGTIADGSTTDAPSVGTASAATRTRLAGLNVLRSSNTVYPIKDGYEDSVRFAVNAMNASGSLIPVVGSAVLTKGSTTIDTWHIDGSTTTISWNGRVHHAIETGLYTLKVTAWSPDGSKLSARALVRVMGQHLVKHALTVVSNVGAKSVSADLPRQLLKAYATGEITCRVVTVASVHGAAKLVYSHGGVSRSVVLRNGSHTTKALPVPQGFSHVTITHSWAKGAAHLKSLHAIWTYYTLS